MTEQTRKPEQRGAVSSFWYDVTAGWEKKIFVTSDCHFDSIYCARGAMAEQFDAAKSQGAKIIIVGDWFDAMQGRFDPRRSMAELRPEYRREDYYDFVVKDSADWLEPYADNLELMADGNHELSVLKAANTNLMDRLVSELNRRRGVKIMHGGYGGWIRYMFDISNGTKTSVRIKYFHGSGGEAPVSRGAIQTNRQAVYLPDANIIINGHSHNSYDIPITRERLSGKGEIYFDYQHHVRTPGYKQAYGDGTTGWEVTRGGVPKPIGGAWIELAVRGIAIGIKTRKDIIDPQPVSIEGDEVYSGHVYDDDGDCI